MTRPVDGVGGHRDDAARTRRKNLISAQGNAVVRVLLRVDRVEAFGGRRLGLGLDLREKFVRSDAIQNIDGRGSRTRRSFAAVTFSPDAPASYDRSNSHACSVALSGTRPSHYLPSRELWKKLHWYGSTGIVLLVRAAQRHVCELNG